ncbi:MAG: hypothetical protein E7586_05415 [Ruminococcaceae bacterium]|nr:hypothetical protein [Oscillospiraceae bacterium]
MNSNVNAVRGEDDLVLGLMRLYENYGYKKFKMRKFEKYDLYLENKSFLRNANIITVTDPAGHLLALKPDITLSIVKNVLAASLPQKLYYSENIYLGDRNAGEIKETTQVGLEYIGDLDVRALAEILLLAAESLERTGGNYRIAISHMGIVSEILDSLDVSEAVKDNIYHLISDKNLHGIKDICLSLSFSEDVTNRICGLVTVGGEFASAIKSAESLVSGEVSSASLKELSALSEIITTFGLADKFVLDFSVMNDVSYYNGLLFQGFISGVPKAVLSGGRYDNLVRRFGCETSAAGFAVSIDPIKEFQYSEPEFDYDVLLLYAEDCDPAKILKLQTEISEGGESCIAVSSEPEWLRYRRRIIVSSDGSMKNE